MDRADLPCRNELRTLTDEYGFTRELSNKEREGAEPRFSTGKRANSAPELTVKKGNSVFQIRIQGFPRNQASPIEAKEKTLALDVLAKL
jgi:hypothetical protein